MKIFYALALFLVSISSVGASEISIGLTDDVIEVDAGFAGAELTLFGAVTGIENPADTVDIICVIKGPASRFVMRPLEKRGLIWTTGDAVEIKDTPGLYISAATRAVNSIVPLPQQAAFHLRKDFIPISITSPTPAPGEEGGALAHVLPSAFLTEAEELGLYRDNVGRVAFEKGVLFTIKVDLPATTPVGEYDVDVFLYRDGELLGRDDATLAVRKVGIERQIYELAHDQPVAYGVLCVAISLFAGWIAALAFRK